VTFVGHEPRCPACTAAPAPVLAWQYSGLGHSVFDYAAQFEACASCGLVFIANVSDRTLARFYDEECAYFSSAHFDTESPENITKYATYRALLVEEGVSRGDLLDVGCGRGGFLRWVAGQGWQGRCVGLDADVRSLPVDPPTGVSFQRGFALELPFEAASWDLLTCFHVLEHLRDLDRALGEACRVLRPGGHLLVEVPDAERYDEAPIGTAFWIGIREHVNHFSADSLARVMHRHGLEVVRVARGRLPTPEFSYPSLLLLGRRCDQPRYVPQARLGDIALGVRRAREALVAQSRQVEGLIAQWGRVAIWGLSAELMSLLPLLALDRVTLCDGSRAKQQTTYRGQPILAPEAVERTGGLVIAPYLHREAIRRAAVGLGWQNDRLVALE
jgi:ubiquinone/menaquinone biosynthesis C-methylase UbiE